MKKTFTVLTDQIDMQGDRIVLSGIKLPSTGSVIVNLNFDRPLPIGVAQIEIEDTRVKATMDLPDEYLDHYPAVGFQLMNYHVEGDIRILDEIKLQCLGLCTNPNADPNIKSIREQIKDNTP